LVGNGENNGMQGTSVKQGAIVRGISYALTIQLCVMVLGGCGLPRHQIVATHAFGNATATLGSLSEAEFIDIRQGIIDMNAALLTLDPAKTTANLTLDAPTSMPATARRVAAARALRKYGELLLALATADSERGLQKAAQAFRDSLDSIAGEEWTEEQRNAVQDIIEDAGSLLLERKKAVAVKRIVPAYEKPVDKFAALLAVDFSLDEEGFLQAYEITARRLQNAAIRVINSGGKYSLADRESAVRAYRMADMALVRTAELEGRFTASISMLRKASRGLAEAIENRKYGREDIKHYAKQIRELVDAYQVLAK
jgi:hypothetical protein